LHHPRSTTEIVRFRLAAALWFGICLLVPVSAGLLLLSLLADDRQVALLGVGLAMLSAGLVIPQWAIAARSGCPLCNTPVLAPKGCVKHRHAKKLLGSHRLRVAAAILFTNWFRCPYCNEATALEVRNRTADRQRRSPVN